MKKRAGGEGGGRGIRERPAFSFVPKMGVRACYLRDQVLGCVRIQQD